jgi:1,4-dihydroxy-2-naphthoate octaprenyltransferase
MLSTLLHLRVPFSYFLLPVYIFSLGISPNLTESNILWSFVIIHFLLYPASNGYNSYFDKDEKSIGGLKNPPPVNKSLYYVSLLMDLAAIVLAYRKISLLFAMMILTYGLISKSYSHPSIRIKKYPILGWLVVGIFQGCFSFFMCYVGINNFEIGNLMHAKVIIPASLTTVMLLGNYPMTQVYQHEEDAKHGDKTISMLLGIRGTFIFAQIVFAFATLGFTFYFNSFFTAAFSYAFLLSMVPVVLFFMIWFYQVWKDNANADHARTMWLNFISATCLNSLFIYFFLANSHIASYFSLLPHNELLMRIPGWIFW